MFSQTDGAAPGQVLRSAAATAAAPKIARLETPCAVRYEGRLLDGTVFDTSDGKSQGC
jgi:FKBP-type peptidyl-prolyl cis-trans isomerase